MASRILYCGDTNLETAAAYLAGIMSHAGWDFDYVASDLPLPPERVSPAIKLYIFSDFPAARVTPELQAVIVKQVQAGAGLLMIGGWESFHGQGGNWDGTPIAELLGLGLKSTDDRRNNASPAMLASVAESADHPILRGLPWREQPAFVGGWNEVVAGTATVLLNIQRWEHWTLSPEGSLQGRGLASTPGLTVQNVGQGRAVAFLSDAAPHWVGSFVDWGPERVTAQAPRAGAIEVGSWYAQFWQQLLQWTGQLTADDVRHSATHAMRQPG